LSIVCEVVHRKNVPLFSRVGGEPNGAHHLAHPQVLFASVIRIAVIASDRLVAGGDAVVNLVREADTCCWLPTDPPTGPFHNLAIDCLLFGWRPVLRGRIDSSVAFRQDQGHSDTAYHVLAGIVVPRSVRGTSHFLRSHDERPEGGWQFDVAWLDWRVLCGSCSPASFTFPRPPR